MAIVLKDIKGQVKDLLPFLLPLVGVDDLIDSITAVVFTEMQPQTGVSDGDLYTEGTYNGRQIIFFANYVAYKLLLKRIVEAASGNGTEGDTGTGNTVLTKAEVDVLSVEFDAIKSSDKDLGINTETLLDWFKSQVCASARSLGYSLAICGPLPVTPAALRFIQMC